MADELDTPEHPPLDEWLNQDEPPEHLPAFEVEVVALTAAGLWASNKYAMPSRPMTFQFERDDGTSLIYARWLNPETGAVEYRLRGRAPS